MEEYADFADMETEETNKYGFTRKVTNVDEMKKLEYESLDRQRRLQKEKYNDRKKAAIKKQQK